MARDRMMFFRSYYEAAQAMTDPKERLAFYEAIFALGLDGRDVPLPKSARIASAVLAGIRPNIVKSAKKVDSRNAKSQDRDESDSETGKEKETSFPVMGKSGETSFPNTGKQSFPSRETNVPNSPILGEGEGEGEGEGVGAGVGEDGGEAPQNPPAAGAASHTDETEGWKPCESTYGKPKRFTPPTVEEVAAYCKERGNKVDAGRFCDFYTAKGWKVGNAPMKDWRAAVRNWERTDNQAAQSAGSSFDRDVFWGHAMADSLAKHGKGGLT